MCSPPSKQGSSLAGRAAQFSSAFDIKRLQGLQITTPVSAFGVEVESLSIRLDPRRTRSGAARKNKGFTVPEEMLTNRRTTCARLKRTFLLNTAQNQSARFRLTHLRARPGEDRESRKARKLIAMRGGVERFSIESLGWLLPNVRRCCFDEEVDAIRRHFSNRVIPKRPASHFATPTAMALTQCVSPTAEPTGLFWTRPSAGPQSD